MSYKREVPCDLFNEAGLLKCMARLSIVGEKLGLTLAHETHSCADFVIDQDPSDGSIYMSNVEVWYKGRSFCSPFRPLNSRQPWPLYVLSWGEEVAVFDDHGDLTPEFIAFLDDATLEE